MTKEKMRGVADGRLHSTKPPPYMSAWEKSGTMINSYDDVVTSLCLPIQHLITALKYGGGRHRRRNWYLGGRVLCNRCLGRHHRSYSDWRASRTERQQALATIDDKDHRFISRGIHAGPNIWLLKRVRAPILEKAPTIIDDSFTLIVAALGETMSTSGWVHLAMLLSAYGVRFPKGDSISIHAGFTTLPVHKLWLLPIGLRGRYRARRDKGRMRPPTRVVRLSTPGPSHRRIPRTGMQFDDDDPVNLGRGEGARNGVHLWGLAGKLEITPTAGADLLFKSAPAGDLACLHPDVLPIKTMLMLALGCMPLRVDTFSSMAESVLESDHDDQVDSDDFDEQTQGYYPREIDVRSHHKRTRPSQFVEGPRERLTADAYQLFAASEHEPGLATMLRQFGADNNHVKILGRVRHSMSLSSELREYDGMTYVPAERSWVRVAALYGGYSYILRADAQGMAHSLLTIPWHPESYLVGGSPLSVDRCLLQGVSRRLGSIANRISNGVGQIGLREQERLKLQ